MRESIQTDVRHAGRKPRTCAGCGHRLGRGNRSGLCRTCNGHHRWAAAGDGDLVDRLRSFGADQLARLLGALDRGRVLAAVDQLEHHTAAGPAGA